MSQFLFAVIDFPAKTLSKSGKMVGDELGDWAIWSVAEQSSKQIGIEHFGAHDLRRTCAKLCRKNGGDLEQIKFLLGPLLNTDDRTLFRLRAGDRRCCERQFGTMTWGAAKSCYRSRAGGATIQDDLGHIGDTSLNGNSCTFAENQRYVFYYLGGRWQQPLAHRRVVTHSVYIADYTRPL